MALAVVHHHMHTTENILREPFRDCPAPSSTTLTHGTAVAYQQAVDALIQAMDTRMKALKQPTAAQQASAKKKSKAKGKAMQEHQMKKGLGTGKKAAAAQSGRNVKLGAFEGFTTASSSTSTPHSIYIAANVKWYDAYNNTYAQNINHALAQRNKALKAKKAHAKKVKHATDAHAHNSKLVSHHMCKMRHKYSGASGDDKCPPAPHHSVSAMEQTAKTKSKTSTSS